MILHERESTTILKTNKPDVCFGAGLQEAARWVVSADCWCLYLAIFVMSVDWYWGIWCHKAELLALCLQSLVGERSNINRSDMWFWRLSVVMLYSKDMNLKAHISEKEKSPKSFVTDRWNLSPCVQSPESTDRRSSASFSWWPLS